MELKWVYDPNTRISKTEITSDLYYTTDDGGQTIKKYVNGELVKTMHKYGPDRKFDNVAPTGIHVDNIGQDEWPEEVIWLSETYPEKVGILYQYWQNGYKNKNGEIEDIGVERGMGILSEDNPISINRICQPASIQEWWDYDTIAQSPVDVDEDCGGTGVKWIRHKVTGQIYRVGGGHPLFPCCMFPKIHGPWPVDESDIELHKGKYL